MRLLVIVLALAGSCACASWKGSQPLPDHELLKGCKDSCPPPGFCAHDGVRWVCFVPQGR